VPFVTSFAWGEPPPVDVRSDDVTVDARNQELLLHGNVRVDSPPFHLSSDELRAWRTSRGVVVKGEGRLAFCPCLGEPLAVAFDGATVAPPGDLVLEDPRLEVFRVPVFWLPVFWLRSPGRLGLLPPDLAYRGEDGLFLGDGVHLPWRPGDPKNGLDVRAGAYLKGGVAADALLRTEQSTTHVRWDHLRADGVSVDARGAFAADPRDARPEATALAWDADVVRGTRGVIATTELDAASRVFDRLSAEGSWRSDGWTFAAGARATNLRGSGVLDLGAAGPVASARRGGTIGSLGAYDADVEGGSVGATNLATLSYARGGGGAMLATRLGALGASLALRGLGDVAEVGSTQGSDAAGSARAELTLPFARSFASSDATDPYRHRIEPRIGVSALASRGDELLGYLPSAGGIRGGAWVADGGAATAIGRWGAHDGLELAASAGAAGDDRTALPVARWRGAASSEWVGLGAEGAHVLGLRATEPRGNAFSARVRLGPANALSLAATVAARDGTDPILARALTDAPLEPSSGFLAAPGWTGGARLSIPWSPYVITRGGADADLSAEELVAARGSVEIRDKCGCVVIRANGAHRIGRDGVDVWLTIDLAPSQ
jgi:hypothetical protein